ncbi:hypothetical protein L3X38_017051 [Prunus dulcis]|uniref:DUF4283 domain-containing protein n=1 Tax=Prunus dulcis TaxID=3755 RepID=A0AAD4Z9E9_PRUDU|nr:hypothetical protein L3X38_017051 [Prunus dulcis]
MEEGSPGVFMKHHCFTKRQKWRLKGDWKLIDLVNDYFVVKFDLEEDLNCVLTSGPWIIAGQYLVMQKWRPSFCPAIAHITCKFAHLYVELDLTKPLEAFVQINQHWYNIEYEGLSEIYYMCGRYGHKREVCSLRVEVQLEKTPKVPIEEGSMAMNINFGDWVNKLQDWDSRLRGPWMNVQPRRKYKTNFKDGGGKSSSGTSKGSIFDPLRQVGEDFGREVDRLLVEPSLSSKTVNIMENVVPKGGKI